MSSPYFQPLDPASPPGPTTPADGPSDAAGYASVTPHGAGPAPYDINAPQDIAGISAAFDAANGLTGAGVLYPRGPRQEQAAAILDSPQGMGPANVLAGFPDYENNNITPPGMDTPDQGTGAYPGTTQGDVPKYPGDTSEGLAGVPPESGSMTPGPGLGYPGTTQPGIRKYGTS